jgi:hypothetical protein
VDFGELAGTAGLLLVAVAPFGFAGDGFAVRNFRFVVTTSTFSRL